MEKKRLRIDIVSDIVCPWCIIGYKRLEKALEIIQDDINVIVHWHAFLLNRDLPREGKDYIEHLMQKYHLTRQQVLANREQLVAAGSELGFVFNYYDGMKTHNTIKAHQLLHYAGEHGKKQALKLRLMTAHFSEQKNISDIDTLVAEAAVTGLDEVESRAVLQDGCYETIVRAEEASWVEKGVSGVPTYVFNQKQAISGAHEPETLASIMRDLATTPPRQ